MSAQFNTLIEQDMYRPVGNLNAVIGFILLSYFLIYQVAYKRSQRSLKTEIFMAVFASAFLSVGVFFTLLGIGIYI